MTARSVLLSVAAVCAAGVVAPTCASATTPMCEGITVTGTVTGSHTVGPGCVDVPDTVKCVTQTTGLSPEAVTTVEVCVPNP